MKLDPDTFNSCYPVSKLDVYKSGFLLKREKRIQSNPTRGDRKKISHLSRSSLRNLAWTAANTDTQFYSMMTLTYLDQPVSGRKSKEHLYHFLRKARRNFGKLSYLWFLEFTRSLKPHYHILVTYKIPENQSNVSRETFAAIWAEASEVGYFPYCSLLDKRELITWKAVMAVHSHAKAWQNLRTKDGGKRYALKYALKPYQKRVPEYFQDVGRFWGCSYDVIPRPLVTNVDTDENEVRERLKDHRCADWPILPRQIIT